MKRIILFIFPVFLLLNACALEIANVIGPGGGYVYYDKGNYKEGWRYKECSPFDLGELKDIEPASLSRALQLCEEQSDEWYAFKWELPSEADLKKMLECFSYGLTRFSSDYYYLGVNKPSTYNVNDTTTWEVVILHKNFDNNLNGVVEKVTSIPDVIRIRPIRKF